MRLSVIPELKLTTRRLVTVHDCATVPLFVDQGLLL